MQEASVMTSLHELRAIEQQRIADERAAATRALEAEQAARAAAEAARLEQIAAAERAERDAELRIEQARADAERQVRLRVEAAEAAERARLAAALEQERMVHEVELRRADIAKRRPTWMLAVTAIAVVGGLAFGAFAVDRMHRADEAQQAKALADADMKAAKQEAAEAVAQLEGMQKTLDELDGKVREAQHALAIATTAAERKHAQELLDEANRKEAAARAEQARLKAIKDKADRLHRIDVTKCAGQVLCK